MVFLAGFSWPPEALPLPLQYLRWLIPTTSGVQAALRLNQMGAPLQSVMPYLGCLLALTVVAGSFVLKFGGKPQGD
jgi:ABC-2 type transport system permease protein